MLGTADRLSLSFPGLIEFLFIPNQFIELENFEFLFELHKRPSWSQKILLRKIGSAVLAPPLQDLTPLLNHRLLNRLNHLDDFDQDYSYPSVPKSME